MTEQEKQLLVKVLCEGLPHKLKVRTAVRIKPIDIDILGDIIAGKNTFKILPYLRPMSSMTLEEKEEYTSYCFEQPFLQKDKTPNLGSVPMCIDWLIANHFDYRGLIGKGLAIEAPEGMYNNQ